MSELLPEMGPCSPWIDGADVFDCCNPIEGTDPEQFDIFAAAASDVMWAASGRLFSGTCSDTVRPCRSQCGCWGAQWSGQPDYLWLWTPWVGGWGWANECGDKCGCAPQSRVKLPGYPVTAITEVRIGGVVQDPDTYRLDGWRWLTKMNDPDNPNVQQMWPSCQNLGLDDDQPGTFAVDFEYGMAPPTIGLLAAAQLACQLARQCGLALGECTLPTGATQIVRQGITIERNLLADWTVPGMTGLADVDAFMKMVNPGGLQRRPAVFSPDIQRYAKRLG